MGHLREKEIQGEKRNKPPFRYDHVGSLLRPERLKKARLEKAAGNISQDQLRAIENEEITRIVEKQKEIGLAAVTDGELRRAWWHLDFLENLSGVTGYEAEHGLQFHGKQTKTHAIKVTGKLDFSGHPMLEDFTFLQRTAGSHTAKMTIPSPSLIRNRAEIAPGLYQDDDELSHDLAQTYKKAIQAFYDAGCRYLQIDDTSWGMFCSEEQKERLRANGKDPERLMTVCAETLNEALAGRPDDLTVTMHICRGNFRSTWIYSGGYEPVAERVFGGINVDGFFLEFDSDRSGGFEPLRFVNRNDVQIVLGLITSKFGELENPDDVKRRIEEASRYVDMNQLCLSPQCGFASTEEGNLLTEEQQWAKLRHVVEIAQDVWK
ncbi:MAG: 5-methyltetrahydropteroyltriglutamate--homocysteine S-methyltransferase [Tuberibacillus sp.]